MVGCNYTLPIRKQSKELYYYNMIDGDYPNTNLSPQCEGLCLETCDRSRVSRQKCWMNSLSEMVLNFTCVG